MVKKDPLNNTNKANTKDGYYISRRNTQGTEKTQIMEWLTVAHIDSLNTVVASDDDAYVTIPIDKLIENNVVSESRPGRDVMRLHKEMAKLMVNLEIPRQRANGEVGTIYKSVVVFPEISYDSLDREVTVKISGKATPQFYHLSDLAHTSLNLDIVLKNITGFWARKIYAICREQLYHNSDIIEFNLSIKELRLALGIVDENSFKGFTIFNRDVLKPALWELGWDITKQKHVNVSTPKKHVADIDLFIRASKIVSVRKTVGLKFQVRPKVVQQPNLLGRSPESITAPTKEYLTSINWSQWNKINQIGEINGSSVLESAITEFKNEHAANAKTNVAGLLDIMLPGLIEKALSEQSKEDRQNYRNQRGKALLEQWKISHPLDQWVEERKRALEEAGFEGMEMKKPEEQWLKVGKSEVIKTLDKEEAEKSQQRLF